MNKEKEKDENKDTLLFRRFVSILFWYVIGFVTVVFTMEYRVSIGEDFANFCILFFGIGTFLLILSDLMEIKTLLHERYS